MLLFGIFWLVHILEGQHVPNPGRRSVVKPGIVLIFGWIFEGSKNHIEQRNIGVIIGMHPFGMMNRVGFRPLDDIPDPGWGIDVTVLKNAQESGY